MDVMNCRNCGRIFNALRAGERLCPACRDKLEKKFQEVKEYLRENPKTPLEVIATDNDVSVKQLKQWVREERLVFAADSPVGIECEMCGAMIRSGRFCENCKNNLADGLSKSIEKPKEPEIVHKKKSDGNKMRFLQN